MNEEEIFHQVLALSLSEERVADRADRLVDHHRRHGLSERDCATSSTAVAIS